MRKNPEKPHPGNLSRVGIEPGPLRDWRACYRLFHSGGLFCFMTLRMIYYNSMKLWLFFSLNHEIILNPFSIMNADGTCESSTSAILEFYSRLADVSRRWRDSVSLSHVPYAVHTIFHCYTNSFWGLLWHAENSRFFRATLHKNKFNGLESRDNTAGKAKGSMRMHKQQVNVLPVQSRSTRVSMLPFVRSFKRK